MEPRETTGERLLAELLGARNSNQSTVTINAGGLGVWISGACCLAAALCSVFALYQASETKADLRATEIVLQAKIQQLENTDNAIRAYINTGKMPPAPEKK
jgi:hypothetical protein